MSLRFLAAVVLVTALAALPGLAAAQWSPTGLTDAAYASPTYGYGVRWHAAEWQVDKEATDGRTDVLQLVDDAGNFVRYLGTDRYGDDPAACRKDLLDTLAKVPNAGDIEPVRDSAGQLLWLENAAEASGLYQFRLADRIWVAWLDCQILVPGRAVLAVAQFGPAEGTAVGHDQAGRVIPTRDSARPYGDRDRPRDWTWDRACWAPPGAPLDFGLGSPFPGMSAPAAGSSQQWFRFHLYQPTAREASASFDANAVLLLDTNDVVRRPVGFAWDGALVNPADPVQSLAPGHGADLTVVFELPDGVLPSRVLTPGGQPDKPSRLNTLACFDDRRGHPVRPLQDPSRSGTAQVSFVVSPAGDELGMVTWLDATGDAQGDEVLLRLANTGSAAWTFDPALVVAEGGLGPGPGLQRPTGVRLGADPAAPGPSASATGPLTLGPGETTTLAIAFPPQALACAHLLMVTDEQIIPLGDGPACGGAGGAAPIIRTGE